MRANCHVGQGASVSVCVGQGANVSVREQRVGAASYFQMFNLLGGHFRVFDIQRHFPTYSSSLLSLLALGPTVILIDSTPVSIKVPKQVDCNMRRFGKLLLFFLL